MNKQFQGNKKRGRDNSFAKRKAKREKEELRIKAYNAVMETGNIEDMARVMGVKLK